MSDCRFGVSPVNYPDPDPEPAQLQKLARNFETLDIASIHVILSKQRTTKVLIRLRGCAG